MNNIERVYGYVNGKPAYSRDEYIFKCRNFGAIESDDELMKYAEKVTSNWYDAGYHRTFTGYYLGDYCLDHPMRDLTTKEYERLKELQKEAIRKEKEEYESQEWKYVETSYWADNSVEETWINKYGEKETRMVVGPHGDCC